MRTARWAHSAPAPRFSKMGRVGKAAPVVVGLNAVIVAVTAETPRVLTVERAEHALATARAMRRGPGRPWPALPFGPLDPEGDATLERGLRGWVRRQTGLELGYVEQLYTFGDRNRDLRTAGKQAAEAASRVLSIAYLALVRESVVAGAGDAQWRDVYTFLPWEDARDGAARPGLRAIRDGLDAFVAAATDAPGRAARRERADICFGWRGAAWDVDRVLERYELLFEAGLVAEAHSGRSGREDLGVPMAADHRRMLATALGRLRGKLRYRPVVFELLPETFTLLRLQQVAEALAGTRLHKQNFRRLVAAAGLVIGTGQQEANTGGRPAELFRFRREVLRERRAPGVGASAARGR